MLMKQRLAGVWSAWRRQAQRRFSTGELYVHHTVPAEVGSSSSSSGSSDASITLGLLNAIAKRKPGVGYFRPVNSRNLELIKRAFHLQGEIATMHGVRRSLAHQLLADDKLDDLLEQIFAAYQSYKRQHDFVLIEGLQDLKDSSSLNAQIASALGAPALLVTDSKLIRSMEESIRSSLEENAGDEPDWTVDAANLTRLSSLDFEKNSVSVLGTLVHKTPYTPGLGDTFSKLFKKWDLPFIGSIPEDPVLRSQDEDTRINRAKDMFDQYIDNAAVERVLARGVKPAALTPVQFKHSIFQKAAENRRVIVLPEGDEPRTVQAADFVLKHGLSDLVLMGAPDKVMALAKQYDADLSKAVIMDPTEPAGLEKYANALYNARKHKGLTLEKARELLKSDPVTLGTCMVSEGDADGMVCGAVHTTADTIRPALQIIKTSPGSSIVSSVFFMCLQDKVLVYGDVALNTNPSSEELATIAISSADTAAAFGLEPKIAMLSYATGDSNSGPLVQKIADAVTIAKSRRPELLIDGPLQYDAAVNPVVSSVKLKGKTGPVAGQANVFIFPDLNASNIACKAVQQHTGTIAIGPILQGLRKPVNDLSRGCTVRDIASTIAATAVQASYVKQQTSN